MNIPEKFPRKNLTFPLNTIYWSCKITKNDFLGVVLVPFSLVLAGIILHYWYRQSITLGMWFALLWTSITFLLYYYGQSRIQNIFNEFHGIVPETEESKAKEKEARAKIYSFYNDKYYYRVGVLIVLIVFPIMYRSIISKYPSLPLQVWGALYFFFTAFIGGVGMACTVSFNRIVPTILKISPFKLNPHHPDYFMGLKPLGNLAVANVLGASSSSLLFLLIFEVVDSLKDSNSSSAPLAYLLFSIIICALVASFIGPLLIIKNAIEKEKFGVIIAHEKEYQERLAHYKAKPSEDNKDILQMMLIERAKLNEIRLFPFETKMIFQIFASILLPIIMLLIQLKFK